MLLIGRIDIYENTKHILRNQLKRYEIRGKRLLPCNRELDKNFSSKEEVNQSDL